MTKEIKDLSDEEIDERLAAIKKASNDSFILCDETDAELLKRKLKALEWLRESIRYQPLGTTPSRRKAERRSKLHTPRVEFDARKIISRRIDDLV
jgi:RNA polymerase-binding transcription factor DksA